MVNKTESISHIDWTVEPQYITHDVNGNELTQKQQEQVMSHVHNEMVEPFTVTNWKTAESRDVWKDLISRMAEAQREVEWLSVMDGETDRKAAIIHVNNYNREKWLRRLGENNLVYRDLLYSEPYDGYSHQHFPTDIHNPERFTYAAIAQNNDVLDKMEEATHELVGHEGHNLKGKMLGFPKCCRDFFGEVWSMREQIDPMYEVACNTDSAEMIDGNPNKIRITDPNPGANVLWRYFGMNFITHIPCSFDCEDSIEIARNRYRLMVENGYEEEANALTKWLNLPFTWSGLHSQALVKNEHMIGLTKTSTYVNEKEIVWGERQPTESVTPDYME